MRPLLLMILDGWGVSSSREGNAIALARTPVMDALYARYPHTLLQASGEAVGLPPGQMGNSEVGHLTLGAGRVMPQDLTRISAAVADKSFFRNPVLTDAIALVKGRGDRLHLLGLVSDGGVHSHRDHLYALLQMAKEAGLREVVVHAFLDGRDTSPTSARGFIAELVAYTESLGVGRIGTLIGRYYAMDRDKRWERTQKAYAAMVRGIGREVSDPVAAVEAAYAGGETDEFILPMVIRGSGAGTIGPGDVVISFNFRADRIRQITRALTEESFSEFPRQGRPPLARYVCLTEYDETYTLPVVFPPESRKRIFPEEISARGLRQLRIAETEKYAHVTFFFNGGVEQEQVYPGEERCLIPSPKVATYDLQPEMSAPAVTEELVRRIRTGQDDFFLVNFANADMVGHTGILKATVTAVETLDACIGRVVAAMQEQNGIVAITADHGNAEQMVDPKTGEPHTAHTTNPVPFLLAGERTPNRLREGGLADVTPTLLHLWEMEQPPEMRGVSLIV